MSNTNNPTAAVNPYNFDKMKYLAATVPLRALIKQHSSIPITELSARISHPQMIQKHTLSGGEVKASFLLLMSHGVGYNLFRPYINLLPEELRVTDQTQALLDIIEQQKQEIEKLKERTERAEQWIQQALKR